MTALKTPPNFATPKTAKLLMLRNISIFLFALAASGWINAQESDATNGSASSASAETTTQTSTPILQNGLAESRNRLPLLLRDVKVLLAEAMMADVNKDTLEVLYLLDRIFELLAEADQFGDMRPQDEEEFNRFEDSFVELYSHSFSTLNKVDGVVTADHLRMDITSMTEPLEVEMGSTQFTVIEDRDGHIPLVRRGNARRACISCDDRIWAKPTGLFSSKCFRNVAVHIYNRQRIRIKAYLVC